ncbi:MAG: DUF1292 domain-containing protein [Erysipelotrichaceae bacterium]|nr:DUF1292 domain-containing protein [Erysipelotrichaceae bacterium]
MTDNELYVTLDDGSEVKCEILFTFDSEDYGKSYVFYTVPGNDEEVYVSSYDEEGNLFWVEDEAELEMANEVLGTFIDDEGDEE